MRLGESQCNSEENHTRGNNSVSVDTYLMPWWWFLIILGRCPLLKAYLGERRWLLMGGGELWTSFTVFIPYCCRGGCSCCWVWSSGFELRGGEISSIKSEVEVLRMFDCFDDGTAEKRERQVAELVMREWVGVRSQLWTLFVFAAFWFSVMIFRHICYHVFRHHYRLIFE